MPLLLVCALVMGACSTSQRRVTYNSLASVGYTTDTAVQGYLDLVVLGAVSTNSVPTVMKSYTTFQAAFNSAVAIAQFNTNAPAPSSVLRLSSDVLSDISAVKGGGL